MSAEHKRTKFQYITSVFKQVKHVIVDRRNTGSVIAQQTATCTLHKKYIGI